jgi:hypothetical protein
MKIVTTTRQVPEVGDKVLVAADLENMCEPSAEDVIGTIQSFARHCRNCPEYCNVTDGQKIIDCPNLEDLCWNAEKGYWQAEEK